MNHSAVAFHGRGGGGGVAQRAVIPSEPASSGRNSQHAKVARQLLWKITTVQTAVPAGLCDSLGFIGCSQARRAASASSRPQVAARSQVQHTHEVATAVAVARRMRARHPLLLQQVAAPAAAVRRAVPLGKQLVAAGPAAKEGHDDRDGDHPAGQRVLQRRQLVALRWCKMRSEGRGSILSHDAHPCSWVQNTSVESASM